MMNNKNENNEYNFNNEALHFESNPYVFETDPVKKAPVTKKHIGAKITAFLMAMALVSGGSIAAYREFAPEYDNSQSSSEEVAEVSSAKSKNSLTAETISLIDPSDNTGNALTTEQIVDKVLPSVVGIEPNSHIQDRTAATISDTAAHLLPHLLPLQVQVLS